MFFNVSPLQHGARMLHYSTTGWGPNGASRCRNPRNLSHHYVLVAMDYFTKWLEVYAVPDQSVATIGEHLVSEMFCCFGVLEELHSDKGRNS